MRCKVHGLLQLRLLRLSRSYHELWLETSQVTKPTKFAGRRPRVQIEFALAIVSSDGPSRLTVLSQRTFCFASLQHGHFGIVFRFLDSGSLKSGFAAISVQFRAGRDLEIMREARNIVSTQESPSAILLWRSAVCAMM
jgi:hypothetical protein